MSVDSLFKSLKIENVESHPVLFFDCGGDGGANAEPSGKMTIFGSQPPTLWVGSVVRRFRSFFGLQWRE